MSLSKSSQKDVLPLPVGLAASKGADLKKLSHAVRSRVHRRQAEKEAVRRIVLLLNRLYSPRSETMPSPVSAGDPREAALLGIDKDVPDLGCPPDDLSEATAYQELCLADQYGHAGASLVGLVPELLSLPPRGSVPIPVTRLLGKDGASLVQKFLRDCILTKQEASEAKRAAGLRRAYTDPVLEDEVTYGALIGRLLACGMVDISTDLEIVEEAGLFAVAHQEGNIGRSIG